MIKRIISIVLVALSICAAMQAAQQRGFAVVIDPISYEKVKIEVDAYAQQIEQQLGLKIFIVQDLWGVPDSIRSVLHKLYTQKNAPIEGVVLMGDIPVPMIRDAQHLTSAFKMNQELYERQISSVPSDRFYDDFDLRFHYLDQDSVKPLYHYYSLTAESAQYIQSDIYSGRIKPADTDGVSKYVLLRNYLRKVVSQKSNRGNVEQILFFSGHGFISESLQARIDEKEILLEHFPWLKRQQNSIGYIDHSRENHIKFRLMNELQRHDLDIALLHHHGDHNIQYLNSLPKPNGIKEEIENIQLFLRESMRHASEKKMNVDSLIQVFAKRYDVPLSWFDKLFDTDQKRKDSTYIDDLDLYLQDFKHFNYRPSARFILFDACFNGSFHLDHSIANAYIFSDGKTIATAANSVNVLQDKWHDRYLGLTGLGMVVGNVVRYNPYLESHLIGDPTYTFAPVSKEIDINEAIATESPSFWKNELKRTKYAAVRTMAIEQLVLAKAISSAQLLDIYKTSSDGIVRLQCLVSLSSMRNDDFISCLQLAINDGFEMVQRFAMNFYAKSGDERLIPALISATILNNTGERLEFSLKLGMMLFDKEKLLAEFDRQFVNMSYINPEGVRRAIRHAIEENGGKWATSIRKIYDPESSQKNRADNIRTMRNCTVHFVVPELLSYLQSCNDAQIQQKLLESLGWFYYSYQAPAIAEVAKTMSRDSSYPEAVRAEALKTYNRLK